MLKTIANTMWSGELKFSEKLRPAANLYAISFAVIFAAVFMPLLLSETFANVGPGLGEQVSFQLLWDELAALKQRAEAGGHDAFFFGVVILLCGAMFARALAGLRAYFLYSGPNGEKYPMEEMWVWGMTNFFGLLGAIVLGVIAASVIYLMGGDFASSLNFVGDMGAYAHSLVDQYVPTLVELPSWLAMLCIYLIGTFIHYWAHRWSHDFRAAWLLFHRIHHMPRVLSAHTTTAVFFTIPLLVFVVIPYNFAFAAATKLFSEQPLYIETAIVMSLVNMVDPWSHATALYKEAMNNRWLRTMGFVFNAGAWHAMHHAAELEYTGKRKANNTVNIGGGNLFCMWDIAFGTYVAPSKECPQPGLTGNPDLVMNPFRQALAGTVQIAYELWHNKSWKDRFWILFGSSDWNPPISKDFALKQS
jgi:sterol desaturase/sphingolipid hydroxylase (fatty acid hydroxylase superfamily)